MTRLRRFLAAAVLATATAATAGGAPLANPSFEAGGDAPEGWTASIGAQTGDAPDSSVSIDRTAAKDGTASLRLSGDASTQRWRMVEQQIDIQPSERVTLRVAARCRGVAPEGKQYANANAVLVFDTEQGERRALVASPPLRGDRDWTDLVIDTIAPPDAKRVRVGLFLSMTGTVWFDDVRLEHGLATASERAGRQRAFEALAGHLRRTYPFFGMAGRPQADELFARHRDQCIGAKDEVAFLNEVHAMLAELNDVHVNVETAKRRLPTAQPNARPPNWNMAAIRAAVPAPILSTRDALVGRVGDGGDAIGYALLASLQLDEPARAAFEQALDGLADCKALILDLRPNGGGDEQFAARVAGRFTDRDVVYARAVFRDPLAASTDAFTPPVDRVLKAAAPGRRDARPVVVLQGPYCVSSTEGFLMMMRALPNVTTIGLPSRGASGNPAPFDLLPGVKVWTSRWRSLTPDGECIEGAGVAPKIVVDAPHEKSDPTLERALAELRR